jgi:hypothetical protein
VRVFGGDGDGDGERDVDAIEKERCRWARISGSRPPCPRLRPLPCRTCAAPRGSRAVPWRWRSAGAGAGVLLASSVLTVSMEMRGSVYVLPSPPRYAYANVHDTKGDIARGWVAYPAPLPRLRVRKTRNESYATVVYVHGRRRELSTASFAFRRNLVPINFFFVQKTCIN